MMSFPRRYDKEIMDDFSITDSRIAQALDELHTINVWLGGGSTSRDGIRELLGSASKGNEINKPVTILDVGSGGSDHFHIRSAEHPMDVVSVDINAGVCRYLKVHEPSRSIVCADAAALPFAPDSVDIVHASLFLHHFTEEEIERLLSAFLLIARRGVVINDLRRSRLALAGIGLLTRLFSKSAMVRNDAPLSVKKGFLRNELLALLARLPCASFTLRRRWAFRWLAVITKR
jgi:ubiquinone/menaquinone biosynthesis C-methylase UbiE